MTVYTRTSSIYKCVTCS